MNVERAPAAFERPDQLLPTARLVVDADARAITEGGYFDVSCAPGCGACCRQAVPVTAAEVRSIHDHLAELAPPERSRFERRISAAAEQLHDAGVHDAAVEPDDYFELGVACPFLVDEACGIREVRPLACREYLVTSDPAFCAREEWGRVVRISATNDVVDGFRRASAELGEPDELILALAMAEPRPPEPTPVRKSGVALLRILTETPWKPASGPDAQR